MIKTLKYFFSITTSFLIICGHSQLIAEDSALSINLSTAFNTDYLFRGFNLYDGASIQPSATIAYETEGFGTFGGSVWSHLSAEGNRKDEAFTEIDYTLTYDISYEAFSFTLGHVFYTFPKDDNDLILSSNEIFASVTADALLAPTFSFYHDYQAFDAQYYELNFSHSLEIDQLGKGFNTTPYVAVGFASNSEKVYNDDGATHVAFGTSFDLTLGDVAFTPSLNYSRKIDESTVSEFWMGITLSHDIL